MFQKSETRSKLLTSTADFMHSQGTSPLAWTIIRSPTTTDRSSSSSSQSSGDERSLSTAQLRNLAYYVTRVFANADRSTGLDFVLPAAEPSGVSTETKRRDSRMENAAAAGSSTEKTHSASHQASKKSGSSRPSTSCTTSSGGSAYMDPGRAKQIQQWVAKTSPERREKSDESEKEGEDDEDEDDDDDEDDDSNSDSD